MSIGQIGNVLLRSLVALSLAFLCWLYARSRYQETLDEVLIPVHVRLADGDQGRHDVEISGMGRVPVSFSGPPSRIRELREQLQRGDVQIRQLISVPEEKQNDGSFRETLRLDPGDVPVPPGVSVCLCEGRNTVPVTVHRIVERLLPVRVESVGEARISQVKTEPATVLVRGPQEVLDQIRAIPTQPYALPPAPETATPADSLLKAEVGLVKDVDGRAIQCSPATVAFRFRVHPRQKTYELADVPISFLCPVNFPWQPRLQAVTDKIAVRVIGPALDETPQVQAYIDLTHGAFEGGRNKEPLRFLLPKDFQLATEGPRLVTFTLEAK